MTRLTRSELTGWCRAALAAVGVRPGDAEVLADATAEAEFVGNRAVGVAHLFDYLDGYAQGRIARDAEPEVTRVAPAVITVDAAGGLAQAAFTAAAEPFRSAVLDAGLAALWINRSFTCGELGYYPRRLAQAGLIAVAAANTPALMSVGGSPTSVLGTNPLAYAVPRPGQLPVVIDQASASTAFVNIRRAAERGERIPLGWALDRAGAPTEDAAAAAAGTLLPFGGHRGGNIALLVEVLATLSGASFSVDAAPFDRGGTSPGIGVFLLGIDPAGFDGSIDRLVAQLVRLHDDHQVALPAVALTRLPESVDLPADLLQRLREAVATSGHPGGGA